MAKDFASGIDGRGVVQVEVAVVECSWISCRFVKKVPKMLTALELHGGFADGLQAAVADGSFVFCKYVHVSVLSHSDGGTGHATSLQRCAREDKDRRVTLGDRPIEMFHERV